MSAEVNALLQEQRRINEVGLKIEIFLANKLLQFEVFIVDGRWLKVISPHPLEGILWPYIFLNV